MPTSEPLDFVVFYSWQSDLPDSTNRRAIRHALRAASQHLERTGAPAIRVVLDEATRDEPGSPDIPASILRKIEAADVFVCDITTINSTAAAGARRCPNPNVLFELGYAVRHLGWGRVVMLFNTAFGAFPADTPFDIDRHRGSPYSLTAESADSGENIGRLNALVLAALQGIRRADPVRATVHETPEQVRRQRDVMTLTSVLSTLHLPTLDEYLLEGPRIVRLKLFHFSENLDAIVGSSLFHFYDHTLASEVTAIRNALQRCLSHGAHYQSSRDSELFLFANACDMPLDATQQTAWQAIEASMADLEKHLGTLLQHVRSQYVEVDVDAASRRAWQDYAEHKARVATHLKT